MCSESHKLVIIFFIEIGVSLKKVLIILVVAKTCLQNLDE